ncbi:AIPR family protein [Phaeobacter sp. A36a-5a]|uniref:AIPR family protein n=1 Tax=Phaeobacter bryozoorum TaxID=1086632 RepID=UPI0035A5C59A
MHLVVKSHLKNYRQQYPNTYDDPTLFEAFVNFIALRKLSSDNVEPEDLIFEGDDSGVDGVLIVVDDAYVSTKEELIATLKDRRRDVNVTVVFTQAKTSEAWQKKEINTFNIAIQDFLSERPKFPLSDKLQESREMFLLLFDFVGVITNGRPDVQAYFATTANRSIDREIVAAFENLQCAIADSGYFQNVDVVQADRNVVNSMWIASSGTVEAQIKTIGLAAFPAAPEIDASYVATVSAKDFVRNILSDEEGKLRQNIFDENVRDYIGSDNDVNSEIAETICDPEKQKRFGVMNNGVTIVSPDVRPQGVDLFMRDFQIINGCQTSNVLFDNREKIGDHANLMIKVVHAREPVFLEDIVRSTNRQSKVQDEQFLATIETVKNIEKYFAAREEPDDQRLYFERRKNQYSGRGIPAIRIFDVKHLARCVGALFLERPDLASRYPNNSRAN